MIRDDEFRISRRPYAVDLSSLRAEQHDGHAGPFWRVSLDALWFRRRQRVTMACLGGLWGTVRAEPGNAVQVLTQLTDGRYGGSWTARWDGHAYASEHPQDGDTIAGHLAVLQPMLAAYPAAPPGYSAWWRYETADEVRGIRLEVTL